jgi:aconitate hydratase
VIERATEDGKEQTIEVPVTCRLDTEEEVSVYEAGGVLQRFAQDFLEGSVA